jgi:hypothetical protein
MSFVSKVLVETDSGSIYEFVRENGRENSQWLVKKASDSEYKVLLCFGVFRELVGMQIGIQQQARGLDGKAKYMRMLDGSLHNIFEVCRRNQHSPPIEGQMAFFANASLYPQKEAELSYATNKELVARDLTRMARFEEGVGYSTKIKRIISIA